MNCQSVRDHLVDHWDRPQGEQADRPVQAHLQQCDSCRQLAAEYSLSHQLLQDLPQAEPAENFEWRLRLRLNQIDRDGFVDPQEAAPDSRRLGSMQFVGSAAAAAVVVLAVGFFALRTTDVGVHGGMPAMPEVVQQAPASTGLPVSSDASNASIDVATPAQLHWATDRDRPRLPNLAPTRPEFLKVVPVSAGVPFGPEATTTPAPSILGAEVRYPPALQR